MNLTNRRLCFVFSFLFCLLANSHGYVAAQTSAAQTVAETKELLVKAGQLLKNGKLVECTELVVKCEQALPTLIAKVTDQELPELKKLHGQLEKAHDKLALEGADLPNLPSWESLLKDRNKSSRGNTGAKSTEASTIMTNGQVSFSRDIAPWMVDQCGRCHINESRGRFSLATYESLMKGTRDGVVLFPGDPKGSRIVETIETGDMPRSGAKVSPENFEKLKTWIAQGAKLDGPSPSAPISSYASKGNAQKVAPTQAKETQIVVSSGKETVSFSRDLAPLLISNCNGCHYNGNQASGGLRFNDFAGLMKGGDSGEAILPGKSDDSLLVKKLLGTSGARMPMGRKPLADSEIELFKTWIREGATFDGFSKDAKLDQIVAKAFATKATHEELFLRRAQRARDKWKVVAPKREASEAADSQIQVIGDIGDSSAKELLQQANNALKQIRKAFKINGNEPLIKGGFTIFAFKQRYDYSEFGTMAENRSLPSEWSSHWRSEVLDSYVAMVFAPGEDKINQTSLVQQITSLWIGSMEGVPKWFADGAGRYALSMSAGVNDARVQPWIRKWPEAIGQFKNVKPFMEGKINDEDSAIIGYGIIRMMHDTKMKNQYDAVIRALGGGMAFEPAFAKSFGPQEIYLQRVLGKPK